MIIQYAFERKCIVKQRGIMPTGEAGKKRFLYMEDKTFYKSRRFCPEYCRVSVMNFKLFAISPSPTCPHFQETETYKDYDWNKMS